MRRIATVVIAGLAVALMGAALAVASSGNSTRAGADSTTDTTTTTSTTTTPASTPTAPSSTRPRHLDGRVVAIDATAKTFDLRVRRHHRRFVVTIGVTDTTVYKKLPNGFDSIEVASRIKANVVRVNDAWVATKVAKKRGHRRSDDRAGIHGHGDHNDDHKHDRDDNSGRGNGHSDD